MIIREIMPIHPKELKINDIFFINARAKKGKIRDLCYPYIEGIRGIFVVVHEPRPDINCRNLSPEANTYLARQSNSFGITSYNASTIQFNVASFLGSEHVTLIGKSRHNHQAEFLGGRNISLPSQNSNRLK